MRSYYRSIYHIRLGMVILNAMIVLFYSSVFLLSTKYILLHDLGIQFIDMIDHIPRDPTIIFFGSQILYGILAVLILRKGIFPQQEEFDPIILSLQLLIAFAIIFLLNMAYPGLLLLVICGGLNQIPKISKRYKVMAIVIATLLYFVSNYSIASRIWPMANIYDYFEIFGNTTSSLLQVIRTILEGSNLLIFIGYMSLFIANQYEENESISQELDMVNMVNKELRSYASVTEKMGENNERKRLARELHDTLGHALTGIAAGIDACLVMIDKDPNLTKMQLQRIRTVVTQGINDVRNSLNKLRPGALEQQGFKGALQKMIDEFSSLSDLEIDLQYEIEGIDFEKVKEDVLFRMIQECITNAKRHGKATKVQIRLWIEQEEEERVLNVWVHDNGTGSEKIVPGYGLTQMKERIATIHGTIYYSGMDGFLSVARIPIQKGEFDDSSFDRG